MDTDLKTSIWQQFGASIDYLAGTMSDHCLADLELWHSYRSLSDSDRPKSQDGLMRTVLFSSAISAAIWVMWTLATDARDSTPWHLTIWLTLVVVATLTMIVGKGHFTIIEEKLRYSHPILRKLSRMWSTTRYFWLNEDGELYLTMAPRKTTKRYFVPPYPFTPD